MADQTDTRRYLTEFDSARTGHILTDVLVIGSGVAGLRAAIEASRFGRVTLTTKRTLDESSTSLAQGGIAAVWGVGDSPDRHFQDTLRTGAGLCKPEAVRKLVDQGPARVDELIAWGMEFDHQGESIQLTTEGGHSVPRVLHAGGDSTGRALINTLSRKARSTANLRILESCFVIDLLTVEDRCVGAVTHHANYGHQIIWSNQTILAGGGCGRLFRETTNPPTATGDSLAMAYRAGALLADLEMVQFHPTTLYVAGAARTLISEAVRGEGAYLVDGDGFRFMQEAHPDAELAPRDIVSRAIRRRMTETKSNCVYLDARHFPSGQFEARFPGITELCRSFQIDPTRDLIPVRPTAHYMIGGVVTDSDAATTLKGLFCCGEAACSGLHGANRLASNSLLEGLVFGATAGETAGQRATQEDATVGPTRVRHEIPSSTRTELDLLDIANSLRSLMWRNVGIARRGDRLDETREIIEFWNHYVFDKVFSEVDGWEVQNMLTLGRLMAAAARERSFSLGVHYRVDAPEDQDPPPTAEHTAVRRADGVMVQGWLDQSLAPLRD